ncbi:MAG: RIP metalloprotease RseP [Chloroflexota bacterium]|nr:RIP metalloprotease RseP [Chloroflexota bacterium]
MPEGLLSGLLIIPILAVLILVHEIGHFVAARSVEVKVEEFGIGIPPRLKGWTRNGVVWSVNWIPFGGFVRVLGEDGKNMDSGSMNTKSPLQRAFFLVAGSAMNFLLAIIFMVIVVGVQGLTSATAYVSLVQPDSPAAAAGWQFGDQIVEVAGVPVDTVNDITRQTNQFLDRPMSVIIDRGGERIESTVTPRSNPPAEQGATGIEIAQVTAADVSVSTVFPDSLAAAAGLQSGDRISSVNGLPATDNFAVLAALQRAAGSAAVLKVDREGATEDLTMHVPADIGPVRDTNNLGFDVTVATRYSSVPPSRVIPVGVAETWTQVQALFSGLGTLLTGGASLGDLAGPIGMGQLTSQIVEQSAAPLWFTIAQLTIFLSLNLGILNLLPLPALDGGRLLFVLVEVIRGGRRISPEREGLVHFAGLVLLLGFMFVIAFLDIGRIIGGQSFLP